MLKQVFCDIFVTGHFSIGLPLARHILAHEADVCRHKTDHTNSVIGDGRGEERRG